MNELITHIIMGSIYTGTLYYFFIYLLCGCACVRVGGVNLGWTPGRID